MKPFSQACENNKQPILDVLSRVFTDRSHVLEIGSGTGQHAVFFAANLPHVVWQTSDRHENLAGIIEWCEDCSSKNLQLPIELDVTQSQWPKDFDAVFSANTAHIMSWELTQLMIEKVGRMLPQFGKFALYGPFNYRGKYTSDSNQRFDAFLQASNPHQGIRDFEKVDEIATKCDLKLLEDNPLPANNRLILWQKA